MKNFEQLYKILMNEAEYEDLGELEQAEDDLNSMDPSSVNQRVAQVNSILQKSPSLSKEDAEKIVDSGLYDVWVNSNSDSGLDMDDVPVDVDDIPELDDSDFEATEDDWPDIPAYDAQRRQDSSEMEY